MTKKPKELHPLYNRSWLETFFKDFNGLPPKLVGKTAITGVLSNPSTKRKVTIRINEIISKATEIKIGAMGDTSARMDQNDYRTGFEFVERVYKSTSKENIIAYEVELIKKFKVINPKKVVNISTNRASRLTTYNGFYYIYVVYNI